ncbi:MAG TPA: hypothetical protein VIA81_09370 [Acidimicrobiia bacterium]|jgi:hypothetical protein
MTLTATRPVGIRRPWPVTTALWLLVFLAATALAGGVAMFFGLGGDQMMLPDEWLLSIPLIDSWMVPSLVLGIGFGLGSFFVAYGLRARPRWRVFAGIERWTNHHWAWAGTILIGAGHVLWIALEMIFLPGLSWFHFLYGGVGLALLLLPFTHGMREALRLEPIRA